MSVGRKVGRPVDALRIEEREEVQGLLRADDLERKPEGLPPSREPFELLDPLRR
jgi:hypothetical protein